jgi:4-hydroxy-tetrahydrodipicolinate reductase
MRNYPQYEISITEIHHIHKKDAPSGTAIKLAEDIIQELPRKQAWTRGQAEPDKIAIESVREDEITGIHRIIYDSEYDTLELSHSAKSRKGFALGAVLAAEFLLDKKGFFTMDDLLQF